MRENLSSGLLNDHLKSNQFKPPIHYPDYPIKEHMKIFNYLWEKIIIAAAERMMRAHSLKTNKMAVISGDYVSLKAMLQGRFEDAQLSVLEEIIFPLIKNRQHCLDIGANIGNHSIAFSKFFDNVHAFEPNSMTFDILEINAKWNPRIRPYQLGASNSSFTATARVPAGNLGAAEIIRSNQKETDNIVHFQCIRIDEFIDPSIIGSIGFIKIDVEGHEFEALTGCQRVISSSEPIIAFELLKRDYENSGKKIIQFLRNNGYHYYYEINRKIKLIEKIQRKNYKMIIASKFFIQ